MTEPIPLPRLLYVSDVTPDAIPGNAAMYRLLQNYPPSLLHVLLGNVQPGRPDLRLRGPTYETLRTAGVPRLMRTRFAPLYSSWLYATTPWKTHMASDAVERFKPQAVFTVTHTFGWLIADAIARRHRLPLHLAVWDDHVRQAGLPNWARGWAERKFGAVYRRAASRLCISPNMAEMYENRFGVAGDVLYPSRAPDLIQFDGPRDSIDAAKSSLTFAFAGSVNYGAYADMLGTLARVLGEAGHRLLVFGGLKPEIAQRCGIQGDHVTVFPLLPIDEVLRRMHDDADVLFVPMTFEPNMEMDMRISFPSKLADYTAVGVPILIWGPPYCSSARWAREYPDAALLVDDANQSELAGAIARLANDGPLRRRLAVRAMEVGYQLFDHARVTEQFQSTIARSVRP